MKPGLPMRWARIRRTASGCSARIADVTAGADAAEQRPGSALGDRLPGLERQHRTGLGMLPPRQADLGPLPGLVGLAAADAQPQPAAHRGDILDLERHEFGAAQRAGEAEQQQCPVAPAAGGTSQVATSWRSMASDSAAALRTGRPWVRSSPCSGPWMSRWPGSTPGR